MKRTYLVLVITMLVVGFAAVATNLAINGNINIGFNQKKFEEGIVFTYADTDTGKASISEDAKTITFTSSKLENINQEAVLEYDVANKALQYDANVTVTCDFATGYESYNQWLSIENDLNTPFTLGAGATKTGNLKVKLIKAYNDGLEKDVNIKCELVASPGERVEEKEYVPTRTYVEKMLHGAEPVLSNKTTEIEAVAMDLEVTLTKELVPVKIGEKGTVTYADIYSEWYNYEEKEWANAVILTNEGVNKNFKAGDIIDEKYIESYFVWIPKYRYKIQTVGVSANGQQKAFEIEFGTKDTVNNDTECIAPNKSGENGSCAADKWMTHPAFTSFDVNGFWIGKFNVGYNQNDDASVELTEDWTTEGARQDVRNASKVLIKPNIYSWNGITIYNTFYTAYDYDRDMDSHLTKNTEWGALVYLTYSKYGVCEENGVCAEIAQNNNGSMVTGYAGLNATNEELTPGDDNENSVNYLNTSSVLASSTQNYTGVFDVSGGTYDQVAAISVDSQGEKVYGTTEFSDDNFPKDLKYFDFYDVYDDDYNANATSKKILGDAIAETRSWYGDGARFISKQRPFLVRTDWGKATKIAAGIFEYNAFFGGISNYLGFRIVLSPQ